MIRMMVKVLIVWLFVSPLISIAQQKHSSPITVSSVKEFGMYLTKNKSCFTYYQITNNTDSIIKIVNIDVDNTVSGSIELGLYSTLTTDLYIPPHQSIIYVYLTDYYNKIYGQKSGFKIITTEGLKYKKYVVDSCVYMHIYYWCGGRRYDSSKKCQQVVCEKFSLNDVRSMHSSMKKYLPVKDTISLPDVDQIQIISTDTFGFFAGDKERTITQDTVKGYPIPGELQGYMKVTNTSQKTIRLSRFLANDLKDTLSILFIKVGIPKEGAKDWVLPPGCSIMIRYARRVERQDLEDIPGFIKAHPSFDGKLTFSEGKGKSAREITIPFHIEFKEKDLRRYYINKRWY